MWYDSKGIDSYPNPYDPIKRIGETYMITEYGNEVFKNGTGTPRDLITTNCNVNAYQIQCNSGTGKSYGYRVYWYNVANEVPFGGVPVSFYTEDFVDHGTNTYGPVMIQLSKTRTYKTLTLRAEQLVDMGLLLQSGATSSLEKLLTLEVLVDGDDTVAIPAGMANVTYTQIAAPSCAGAALNLMFTGGSTWSPSVQADVNEVIDGNVTAQWVADGSCSGTDQAVVRFNVAWN